MVRQIEKVVSKAMPISERVQKGYKEIQEGRFRKKPLWDAKLTVLNEETDKLPLVKRKALAIKKQLAEMPIQLGETELVVGTLFQSSLRTIVPFPEYATQEEIEAAGEKLTHPNANWGHFCPSYRKYLRVGLGGLRKIAETKLDEIRKKGTESDKEAWYESVIMSLEAMKNFIRRYSNLALDLANSEANSVRIEELNEIARISQHLLQDPPQTFREALQAFWFINIGLQSVGCFQPLGRFDQNMWPYLKEDLENNRITIEQAQELIDLLWLKFNEQLQSVELAKNSRYAITTGITSQGAAMIREMVNYRVGYTGVFEGGKCSWDRVTLGDEMYNEWLHTMALSGLTPEGEDGTNPLTYLCLNAALRLKLPQPELYVRFHNGSPPDLYKWVADCHRAGLASPGIYNDEVIIPGFEQLGLPVEHARDYTSDGCWETYPEGRTNYRYGLISAVEALDRMLDPDKWVRLEVPLYIEALDPFRDFKAPDPYRFSSFNEVMESFKEQLDILINGFIEAVDRLRDGRLYDIAPLPLLSAFMEGTLESGKDITQDGVEYNFHAPLLAGLSHAADSLAVIKKLCFEEKVIEWSELLDALRGNWQGKESLRQLVMTRVPAYGNDMDYVDDIARDIVEFYVGSVRKHSAKVKSELLFPTGLGTFSMYIGLGAMMGATPDGRLAGEPISSNASPSAGRATSGQTAAVNSFCKLPIVDLQNGSPLDIAIEGRVSLLSQLEAFIKSFIEKKGNILTIAVNDTEKLRAAVKEPEKYRDLKIRVGGWQVYFVDLPPEVQQWQIKKSEQYA